MPLARRTKELRPAAARCVRGFHWRRRGDGVVMPLVRSTLISTRRLGRRLLALVQLAVIDPLRAVFWEVGPAAVNTALLLVNLVLWVLAAVNWLLVVLFEVPAALIGNVVIIGPPVANFLRLLRWLITGLLLGILVFGLPAALLWGVAQQELMVLGDVLYCIVRPGLAAVLRAWAEFRPLYAFFAVRWNLFWAVVKLKWFAGIWAVLSAAVQLLLLLPALLVGQLPVAAFPAEAQSLVAMLPPATMQSFWDLLDRLVEAVVCDLLTDGILRCLEMSPSPLAGLWPPALTDKIKEGLLLVWRIATSPLRLLMAAVLPASVGLVYGSAELDQLFFVDLPDYLCCLIDFALMLAYPPSGLPQVCKTLRLVFFVGPRTLIGVLFGGDDVAELRAWRQALLSCLKNDWLVPALELFGATPQLTACVCELARMLLDVVDSTWAALVEFYSQLGSGAGAQLAAALHDVLVHVCDCFVHPLVATLSGSTMVADCVCELLEAVLEQVESFAVSAFAAPVPGNLPHFERTLLAYERLGQAVLDCTLRPLVTGFAYVATGGNAAGATLAGDRVVRLVSKLLYGWPRGLLPALGSTGGLIGARLAVIDYLDETLTCLILDWIVPIGTSLDPTSPTSSATNQKRAWFIWKDGVLLFFAGGLNDAFPLAVPLMLRSELSPPLPGAPVFVSVTTKTLFIRQVFFATLHTSAAVTRALLANAPSGATSAPGTGVDAMAVGLAITSTLVTSAPGPTLDAQLRCTAFMVEGGVRLVSAADGTAGSLSAFNTWLQNLFVNGDIMTGCNLAPVLNDPGGLPTLLFELIESQILALIPGLGLLGTFGDELVGVYCSYFALGAAQQLACTNEGLAINTNAGRAQQLIRNPDVFIQSVVTGQYIADRIHEGCQLIKSSIGTDIMLHSGFTVTIPGCGGCGSFGIPALFLTSGALQSTLNSACNLIPPVVPPVPPPTVPALVGPVQADQQQQQQQPEAVTELTNLTDAQLWAIVGLMHTDAMLELSVAPLRNDSQTGAPIRGSSPRLESVAWMQVVGREPELPEDDFCGVVLRSPFFFFNSDHGLLSLPADHIAPILQQLAHESPADIYWHCVALYTSQETLAGALGTPKRLLTQRLYTGAAPLACRLADSLLGRRGGGSVLGGGNGTENATGNATAEPAQAVAAAEGAQLPEPAESADPAPGAAGDHSQLMTPGMRARSARALRARAPRPRRHTVGRSLDHAVALGASWIAGRAGGRRVNPTWSITAWRRSSSAREATSAAWRSAHRRWAEQAPSARATRPPRHVRPAAAPAATEDATASGGAPEIPEIPENLPAPDAPWWQQRVGRELLSVGGGGDRVAGGFCPAPVLRFKAALADRDCALAEKIAGRVRPAGRLTPVPLMDAFALTCPLHNLTTAALGLGTEVAAEAGTGFVIASLRLLRRAVDPHGPLLGFLYQQTRCDLDEDINGLTNPTGSWKPACFLLCLQLYVSQPELPERVPQSAPWPVPCLDGNTGLETTDRFEVNLPALIPFPDDGPLPPLTNVSLPPEPLYYDPLVAELTCSTCGGLGERGDQYESCHDRGFSDPLDGLVFLLETLLPARLDSLRPDPLIGAPGSFLGARLQKFAPDQLEPRYNVSGDFARLEPFIPGFLVSTFDVEVDRVWKSPTMLFCAFPWLLSLPVLLIVLAFLLLFLFIFAYRVLIPLLFRLLRHLAVLCCGPAAGATTKDGLASRRYRREAKPMLLDTVQAYLGGEGDGGEGGHDNGWPEKEAAPPPEMTPAEAAASLWPPVIDSRRQSSLKTE